MEWDRGWRVAQQKRQCLSSAPVGEVYIARLYRDVHLVLADARAGWLHPDTDEGLRAWQVHDVAGQIVAALPGPPLPSADRIAVALGLALAPGAALVTGPLPDARDRSIDVDPASLATWTLRRGRDPRREDVIVRGRCVGWLQHAPGGGHHACTVDRPVHGGAAFTREAAALALFAALWSPVPLPDLGAAATTRRKTKARSRTERPISPYTDAELAAAAHNHTLTKDSDGAYPVVIDGDLLGRVHRYRSHWSATTPDGRTAAHRATTRTAAIDALLATPGPLFGDPADTLIHDLDD